MRSYHVIALCAGVGERLRPLTYNTNKSLLEINGKSLIEHWLDALIYSGIVVSKVHLIVGHYGYLFRKLLGSRYRTLPICYHVNPLYKITGAAQSLYLVSHVLRKHDCIVLEGDHYMDPKLMKMLMQSQFQNCVLVDNNIQKIRFDEETLGYGQGGILDSMKWMPPYTKSHNLLGEVLTIFRLSKKASNALATILEQYLLEEGFPKREIIEPFNRLMKSFDFHYICTEGKHWLEIDFEADLKKARSLKFN